MKRVVKIVLIFFVIFAINIVNIGTKNKVEAETQVVQLIFRADKAKYNVGDTITVTCSIKDGSNIGFKGFDGTIVYDSAVMKYKSNKVLLNSADWTYKYNDDSKRALLGYNSDGDGLTNDGDIFQMQFIALKEGNFKVGITNVNIDADTDENYTEKDVSGLIVSNENTNTNTNAENGTTINNVINEIGDDETNQIASNQINVMTNNLNGSNDNRNNDANLNGTGKDTTVANKKIPQTGVSIKVLASILVIAIIGAIAGAFYDRYRGIK